MPARLLLVALLGATACTSPDLPADAPADRPSTADARPADASRAEAAGLDESQAEALAALGVPVYVPVMPEGWRLVEVTADSTVEGGMAWPEYTLRYLTDRRTCLSLVGASEGLGDVMVEEPPHERDVRVAGVPMHAPARLGWGVAGERSAGWEDGRVATEWFGSDVLSIRAEAPDDVSDADACQPASPEAVETLLGTLRPLDPADDAANLGLVSYVEAGAGTDAPEAPAGPDPEAVARAAFGTAEEGQLPAIVETLRQRGRVAVVLVTLADAADDSVRDQRTRVVLVRRADGWHVHAAGQQVRCQAGRGHAEWSSEFCV